MKNRDRSDKDKKYFIDGSTYNCPFCKRGQIKFTIVDKGHFDKSDQKKVYFYVIRCQDCMKNSFHLSEYNLKTYTHKDEEFFNSFPFKEVLESTTQPILPLRKNSFNARSFPPAQKENTRDILGELDDIFFYSVPSSFFTIDTRIPKNIREPLDEASNCLSSNFLTGASAALRKSIYKFLKHEHIPDKEAQDSFIKQHKRIELLKERLEKTHPQIEIDLLDDLKTVHFLTSQELHENDWEDFDAPTLHFLIETVKSILIEVYVLPDEKKKQREKLSSLKKQATQKG